MKLEVVRGQVLHFMFIYLPSNQCLIASVWVEDQWIGDKWMMNEWMDDIYTAAYWHWVHIAYHKEEICPENKSINSPISESLKLPYEIFQLADSIIRQDSFFNLHNPSDSWWVWSLEHAVVPFISRDSWGYQIPRLVCSCSLKVPDSPVKYHIDQKLLQFVSICL